MKVYIRKNTHYYAITRYVLMLIEKNTSHSFQFTDSELDSNIIWDHEDPNSMAIAVEFYENLKNKRFNKLDFNSSILTKDHKKDIVATIFYMVNCLQELNLDSNAIDSIGRFKYTSSYQFKLGNISENCVQKEIDSLCTLWKIDSNKSKSTFFISHDIDTIYGSFLQDGFWALKNMKLGVILNLIIWEFTQKQHWKNIDRIIKINSEYDIRSTFFWLVNRGIGLQNIKNADYEILNEKGLVSKVAEAQFVNGLHKSCSEMSLDEELKKGELETSFNRYHFLKFSTQIDWPKISDSQINFDGSLGFAEHYGFRNSYGKAFQPFDFENNKPFNFIEAPLHFMDSTFHKYMKLPNNEIPKIIIDFYEKNPTNCNFSLLWHNTYFTDYKYGSFLQVYKKIMGYIYENKIECESPNDLITKNKLQW